MKMIDFYKQVSACSAPALEALLALRSQKGKEIASRIGEKKGIPGRERPAGKLVWIHAASVGESQSALVLIDKILGKNDRTHILVTTGTVTSAGLMEKKLPSRAFHQFCPLDHPLWVRRFLDHWNPDLALWLESELWPNMLLEIKSRKIPAALINARMSDKSFQRWKFFKSSAQHIISAFQAVLAQTPEDARRYKILGAENAVATGNLKFSARPLPFDESELQKLTAAAINRPLWVFSSTHKGEEALACRVHDRLKASLPGLLTILVPRHPQRREDIRKTCEDHKINFLFRGGNSTLPESDTDIYIADTMGEMGLFYRLAPVACIGRSFSDDGGGGHNPIEAAQLQCAVLHGPQVQYQQAIYDEMHDAQAALQVSGEQELSRMLHLLLTNPDRLESMRRDAFSFAKRKEQVVDRIMEILDPMLEECLHEH